MNKKGFTLVEILSTIVLIALLLGLGIPGVMKISENMKKRSYNTKVDLIEQAATLWGQDNKTRLQSDKCDIDGDPTTGIDGKESNCHIISVKDLIKEDYLQEEKDITNSCVYIYKKNNRVYSFYPENDTSCIGDPSGETPSGETPSGETPENDGASECDSAPEDSYLVAPCESYGFGAETLACHIIANAINKSNGTELVETLTSKVAEEKSGENEKVLAKTQDDDGISYYFRGNVEDNYVTFANMCWRVVRIDGNSNIKLILEDQDEVCSTTMDGNWDIEASDGTNITMDRTEPVRTINFGYDDSIGKYKMSYLNPLTNADRSMVNAFKYFQTNTLNNKIRNTYSGKNLTDYLVSGNWCLNNKLYSDIEGTTLSENPTYAISYRYFYDSYVRLDIYSKKSPTLKCPVETMETFGDNTTPMYVGTLTADEIVYAGGTSLENNQNYYLINNLHLTKIKSFWSLSPYFLNGADGDFAFLVGSKGRLSYSSMYSPIQIRPSVYLKSGSVISGGEGTIECPYIIA